MRIAIGIMLGTLCVLMVLLSQTWLSPFADWAVQQQRAFQNELALAVHAIRSGEITAWFALLAAAGGYGFVHAVGPGHGKYLIGGVGLARGVSARQLLSIAFAASLAQALWAIVLVYGGLALFEISARHLTDFAETYLAELSYLAIAAVGAVLIWRGASMMLRERNKAGHAHAAHDANCGCGAKHGPSVEEVAGLTSMRETVVLILSVAVRPCTGAVFLLVIAWQLDILLAGACAVLVMGLGTSLLTGLVAVSSVSVRGLTLLSVDRMGLATLVMPLLQIMVGALILMFSILLFEIMVR